jgi:hypothetical protein
LFELGRSDFGLELVERDVMNHAERNCSEIRRRGDA